MTDKTKKAIRCTGSLQARGGIWYTVIQVTDNGIRKSKWETTRLPVKGNKIRAQSILTQRIPEYERRYVSAPMLEETRKNDPLMRNPMYKVDRPRRSLFVGSYYSKEEVEKLLEVLKDDPLYPIVFVDVYYGLRRSELLGLTWDSIDFERNTISVEHKVYRDSENGNDRDISISNELKTRNSRRTLPLIPAVRKVLEAEKKRQAHYRKVFKAEYITKYSKMVFVDPIGNLYTPDYVTRHFQVVLKSNGLRPIRFHDLRHP